jgi:hypothetical protein
MRLTYFVLELNLVAPVINALETTHPEFVGVTCRDCKACVNKYDSKRCAVCRKSWLCFVCHRSDTYRCTGEDYANERCAGRVDFHCHDAECEQQVFQFELQCDGCQQDWSGERSCIFNPNDGW